jgi:hypothetical protein
VGNVCASEDVFPSEGVPGMLAWMHRAQAPFHVSEKREVITNNNVQDQKPRQIDFPTYKSKLTSHFSLRTAPSVYPVTHAHAQEQPSTVRDMPGGTGSGGGGSKGGGGGGKGGGGSSGGKGGGKGGGGKGGAGQGQGPGNAGGWPSTNPGNMSGGGRSNNPMGK